MGFRSASEKTSEGQQSSVVPSIQELTGGSDRSQRGGGSPTAQDSTAQFGLEMYRPGMEVQVQRLVQSHGASQVRQWADEGMTVDTMGKPRDMRQFRDRQQERPAEVPKDIERRNAKSVQRSRNAHHEASKAGDAQVPDSVRDVISSPGQQLDTSIQRAMEERMGDNLGDVRIHTGPSAAKACEDINARAFTVGNHIAFNHGEYDPSSAEGQHVLAHELAHVRQQTGGAVSMLPQKGELEIDPDERLEREAEETAQRVMRGGKIGVHRMQQSDVHVQRAAKGYHGTRRASKDDWQTPGSSEPTHETLSADELSKRVAELEQQVHANKQRTKQNNEGLSNVQQDLNSKIEENTATLDAHETQLDDATDRLSSLHDEVHSGLGEKAQTMAAGLVGTGVGSTGRAATQETMKQGIQEGHTAVDMLGPLGDVMMSSPELTAAGLSALVFTGVVGTATETGVKSLLSGGKSLFDKGINSLLGRDDETDEQREEEAEDGDGGLIF
ncbi:hypothetical protein C455_12713 [Haloferax larsenii JCM 13917]|nr:DUF4157 domain-containing protein [Haloferax larsenii]ELZ78548.1 hypothetical protein C455_12713 [Haloferax larsenii JCM 13917]